MNASRRASLSASLLATVVAILTLASVASAEIRSGESTAAIVEGTLTPETTVVKTTASYDTAGSVTFTLTTAAAPQELIAGEPNTAKFGAFLYKASQCDLAGAATFSLPEATIESSYGEQGAFLSGVQGLSVGEQAVPASKSLAGTTTTLSMSDGALARLSFNCAVVGVAGPEDEHGEREGETVMIFPLVAPVVPPAPPSTSPPVSGSATPAPTPAALAISPPKPLEAKVGKWKTVKVRVSNTGGTASAPGSLRVKAVKGVLVKPESQKLPELTPGTSWTLSIRVQVTEKAKQKSTLAISAAASGAVAKGSLVVKR